ncbi:hypothetical protein E1B28_009706 [Marasmius oreades]|uniref:histone acetyltransferase n=1 Tax=Marasmius oreades TaxID=181124 RepID=A0A9P7USW9_9AGAR|nr:uncharacterized protein E1B28_009706 [Marasmius oreades]KAG7090604.1 hypothetical protein E1B28_009706 [Marasmius oreades]
MKEQNQTVDMVSMAQIGAVRNFDKVHFGEWLIRTWYFSPYPLTENEDPEPVSTSSSSVARIPGVSRARAEDLFAGGLHKSHGQHRSVLWVCDMCFKYMTDGLSWESHKKVCTFTRPPGRKVYQRGAHIIWEVDGAKAKLYCQNLSLFGKLFIDIKTLYFDLDNFMFYILTDAARQKDHMMGYFCKEKQSFDDYNLACITTLPPYQRQGYGMLMIEFSYELSRRAGRIGTPERPLSDLGLRSYVAYWIATLVRFFRKLLSVLPAGTTRIFSNGIPPDLGGRSREGSEDGVLSPSTQRRRRNIKGWEGEIDDDDGADLIDIDESINSLRNYVTTSNPDGSASTHLQIQCSLADISRATNLRIEDAAFALNEMGMLRKWGHAPPPRKVGGSQSSRSGLSPPIKNGNSNGSTRSVSVLGGSAAAAGDIGNEGDNGYVIILTREMVEKVVEERHVKPPCMKMQYILL